MRTFIFRYLKEHSWLIFTFLACAVIFCLIFLLYHLPVAAVLYPAGLCLLLIAILSIVRFWHTWQKHQKLEENKKLTSDSIEQELSAYTHITDEDYREIISGICSELRSVTASLTSSEKETLDYFTVWVHQIKTPLSSMRLHLENEDSPLSRQLMSDLLHTEQYVEMVMTYLRLGSTQTDYVFREISLDTVIRSVIRKFRGDFILRKNHLQYDGTNVTAITDEKWLSFLIGQLLSNALKYTASGTITISVSKPPILCIRDTGIGIAPDDLPRIFEKGFTGKNGRLDNNASGLGLYLCKQICDRLGHSVTVSSEIGKGTSVSVELSQNLT